DNVGGDLVFYQPHSAPGIYARAFLEGRLSEQDLAHYRQELGAVKAGARGLSSYPHPWLMPDFWQFPTGSMGIGPISSIFQARFMRYLHHRGLQDTTDRHVWGVFGDGEMDEPESMSALTLAAREGLDNLTWVVNCNLQHYSGESGLTYFTQLFVIMFFQFITAATGMAAMAGVMKAMAA
ncbi:MAG: potassium-transporting ATPase subunit KdpA, partial [Stenotrophomonas sp.]